MRSLAPRQASIGSDSTFTLVRRVLSNLTWLRKSLPLFLTRSLQSVSLWIGPQSRSEIFADRLGLKYVQLHGYESPEDILSLGDVRVIRAFRLGGSSAWASVCEFLARAELLGSRLTRY